MEEVKITFDREGKIRVLDEDQYIKTQEMKESCDKFVKCTLLIYFN